jgi:hypothetical protein
MGLRKVDMTDVEVARSEGFCEVGSDDCEFQSVTYHEKNWVIPIGINDLQRLDKIWQMYL